MSSNKNTKQKTVKEIMEKIAVLNENVRSRQINTAPKRLSTLDLTEPARKVKFVEPDIPEVPKTVSKDPADNSYAQEIFMYKTNVHAVAAAIVTKRNGEQGVDKMIRAFKRKLYRMFAKEPKNRIRYPLDQVRFESEYYEYRFFLALYRPLHSDEQYQEYLQLLAAAGVAECWVSMRKNNRLLVYEDKIVAKVKSRFKEWSLKLDKLDYYLMDMHARQPASMNSKPTVTALETSPGERVRTEDEDKLLEQILNHSNASRRLMNHQIKHLFPRILRNLQKADGFRWLVFDDDELNKRYQLGTYMPNASMELEGAIKDFQPESAACGSRPGSALSDCSEIAEMRSEMAVTQPRELPQLNSTRFADTQALINGLEGLRETEDNAELHVDQIASEIDRQESMLTPAQTEIVEVSDSPVRTEDDEIEIKEEFFYTLDYLKKFTNIDEHISDEIKQKYPNVYEKKLMKLDTYVERYYNNVLNILLTNTLPPGLRMLTRKERRELEANRMKTGSQLNISGVSSIVSDIPSTIPNEISPITETPLPRVIRKSRKIMYEDDEDEELSTEPDTMPLPNSEDFLPPVFSTQIPNEMFEPPARRNDTPRPATSSSALSVQSSEKSTSPQRPQQKSTARRRDTPINSPSNLATSRQHPPLPTPSSRVATPAFETSGLNETVIDNPNAMKSPTAIKRELNNTSYEGEVEYVEVIDEPIQINDSIDVTAQNIPQLLERQPSCMAALPDNLRGMVSSLFRENRDTTLSQGSGTSGGSGDPTGDTQANISAQPSLMGFHQATASMQANRSH
ncbi:uncharacterized protein LOC134212717 isoform X2 [Armigeres subalbatus]|uniref:uncharacterized protein LOC134212717 isoform X2 n=1 Tax=Armigeres subalbatus TaxID=124917 RepID=UPI002ED2DE7A